MDGGFGFSGTGTKISKIERVASHAPAAAAVVAVVGDDTVRYPLCVNWLNVVGNACLPSYATDFAKAVLDISVDPLGRKTVTITESFVVQVLTSLNENVLAVCPGANPALLNHFTICISVLASEPNSIRRREMIGEMMAAIALGCQGYQMVWGYPGSGHTGTDQLWLRKDELIVVEAKGGTGTLSETPRYAEGTASSGKLGMNDDVVQMKAQWVFVVCDNLIKGVFKAAVYSGKDPGMAVQADPEFEKLFPGAGAFALAICRLLWNPRADLKPEHNDVGLGHVARMLMRCTIPLITTVSGVTIHNGIDAWTDKKKYVG